MTEEEINDIQTLEVDINDVDDLALGLEVCAKKSNMVIEEFSKLIIKLKQENKQLKERIDNQDFLLKSQGKELKELYSIINEITEYLEQPNRDNFDFSKAKIIEIINKGDSNEK